MARRSAPLLVRHAVSIAALALLGCSSPSEPSGGVNVRVANDSSFPFARVEVGFPEGQVSYGSVNVHGVSDYAHVPTAYRYAYIEVEIAGQELIIQPIDYVGETPLGPGRYTYALNVTVEGQLVLELRRDR